MPRISDVPPRPVYAGAGEPASGPGESLTEIARWLDVCPPWGSHFDKGAEVDLAVGASREELIAFELQPGEVGVLKYFGNQTETLADLPHVTFSLLRDGLGVSGYDNICGMKAWGSQIADRLAIPLLPGQRISVVATNAAGIELRNVAARIKGWTWNPSMEPKA